jgi:hypothetical protein
MDIQQVVKNGPKIAKRFAVLSIVTGLGADSDTGRDLSN